MKYKLIVFDMDGVIFKAKNFWLELHKALGTYEEGKALTEKYLTTNYERLVQEVPGRLWKGKDSKVYFQLIDELEYLPGAKETLTILQEQGYKTAIISSGPKHAALKVKKDCGLHYYHTHDLIIGLDGKFTGEYSYVSAYASKEIQLKQFAQEAQCTMDEVVFVGHDYNDVSALKTAGLGVAINPETEIVAESADIVIHQMNELLDVITINTNEDFEIKEVYTVNENDEILGHIPDNTLLEAKKITRASTVIIKTKDGRILLQKRAQTKRRYPNHWDFSVGGLVDVGSSYDETARKETREEVGIDISVEQLIFLEKIFVHEDIKEFQSRYALIYDGPLHQDPVEVAELKWVTKQELEKMLLDEKELFTPSFRLFLNNYFTLNQARASPQE